MISQLSYEPEIDLLLFYEFLMESLVIHVEHEREFIESTLLTV
jgi:hypothetical protein